MKQVDTYVKSQTDLPSDEKYNLVFHVAMYVALSKMRRANYKPQDIVDIDLASITPEFLSYCLKQVTNVFHEIRNRYNRPRPLEVLAKSKDSSNAVLSHFEKTLKGN
jgi:hypothetical protein